MLDIPDIDDKLLNVKDKCFSPYLPMEQEFDTVCLFILFLTYDLPLLYPSV